MGTWYRDFFFKYRLFIHFVIRLVIPLLWSLCLSVTFWERSRVSRVNRGNRERVLWNQSISFVFDLVDNRFNHSQRSCIYTFMFHHRFDSRFLFVRAMRRPPSSPYHSVDSVDVLRSYDVKYHTHTHAQTNITEKERANLLFRTEEHLLLGLRPLRPRFRVSFANLPRKDWSRVRSVLFFVIATEWQR